MSDIPLAMRFLSGFTLSLDLSVPLLRISAGGKALELCYRSSEHSRRALVRAFNSFRSSGSVIGDNDKVITGELPEGDKYDS